MPSTQHNNRWTTTAWLGLAHRCLFITRFYCPVRWFRSCVRSFDNSHLSRHTNGHHELCIDNHHWSSCGRCSATVCLCAYVLIKAVRRLNANVRTRSGRVGRLCVRSNRFLLYFVCCSLLCGFGSIVIECCGPHLHLRCHPNVCAVLCAPAAPPPKCIWVGAGRLVCLHSEM